MCLACRLSTQANLGNMSTRREVFSLVLGNIALVQVQSTVAGFLVSFVAVIVSTIYGDFHSARFLLLVSTSMFTSTFSCLVLDSVLVFVILACLQMHWNPDFIATPLAASLGDIVCLSIFSLIASYILNHLDTQMWLILLIGGIILFILLPFWVYIAYKNTHSRPLLRSSWVPVLMALFISSMGGIVLDSVFKNYHIKSYPMFQPIINGICGNLLSVYASNMSTSLYKITELGILPENTRICEFPWRVLFVPAKVPSAKLAMILLCISIPSQIVFVCIANQLNKHNIIIGVPFVLVYMITCFIQLVLLLNVAYILISFLWIHKIDPDTASIPYLTALGDLSGSVFLLVAFLILRVFGVDC